MPDAFDYRFPSHLQGFGDLVQARAAIPSAWIGISRQFPEHRANVGSDVGASLASVPRGSCSVDRGVPGEMRRYYIGLTLIGVKGGGKLSRAGG